MSSNNVKPGTQEKTLPTAPVELPKQKMLIFVFLGIAVAVLLGYSIYLWRQGKDDFDVTRDKVVAAFAKKDAAALTNLAAKEFVVGQPESDNAATIPPEKVMPRILKLTEATKWTRRFQEFENVRVLYPESGSFQLMFVRGENGWVWSGFLAVNPDDLAALASDAPIESDKADYKEMYKEIQTDPAKGDEPLITD